MATKKTWEWAKRKALLAYRKALPLAEAGEWGRVDLMLGAISPCGFCVLQTLLERSRPAYWYDRTRRGCPDCPAVRICQRYPDRNACEVLSGARTPAEGRRHLRLTIKQLEALDV